MLLCVVLAGNINRSVALSHQKHPITVPASNRITLLGENMKKTTQGFLAGAAGLGLLLGGSTFALWSDSANLDQQSISSGNLEVKVNSTNWRDMSPDRTDNLWGKGHEIKDLKKFKIIPG